MPDDPRGELRWCLSKVRGILDEPGRRRVEASADMVRLDLGEGAVDALEVAAATGAGVEKLTAERLRELALLFAGDFLQGLEIDRSAQFGSWLTAHRRRFRTGHAAILERLVQKLPAEEAAGRLEKWLELAPFDRQAHESCWAGWRERGRSRRARRIWPPRHGCSRARGWTGAPFATPGGWRGCHGSL